MIETTAASEPRDQILKYEAEPLVGGYRLLISPQDETQFNQSISIMVSVPQEQLMTHSSLIGRLMSGVFPIKF